MLRRVAERSFRIAAGGLRSTAVNEEALGSNTAHAVPRGMTPALEHFLDEGDMQGKS